jgi:hypothetical protein
MLKWLKSLFHKRNSRVAPDIVKFPPIDSFEAAGVVFADKNTILAGYQPKKKAPGITGIGGRRQGEETYVETAFRECLEELFDWNFVDTALINKITRITTPLHILNYDGYVNIVYTFDDLMKVLKVVRGAGMKSRLYKKFPLNLNDLILKRNQSFSSEIQGLGLLPLVYYSHKHPIVQSEFREDIHALVLLLCPEKAAMMDKSVMEKKTTYKPTIRNLPKVDGGFTRPVIT